MHVSLEEYEKALVEWLEVCKKFEDRKFFSPVGLRYRLKFTRMVPNVLKKSWAAGAYNKEAAMSILNKHR